jgi:transposase
MRRELPLPREFWEQIPPPVQAALWVLIESYERRIARLEGEVAALKEQLRQNSQNSSRPPSTDGAQVKRRPPQEPSGRKRGAQPGQARYERTVGPLAQVQEVLPW